MSAAAELPGPGVPGQDIDRGPPRVTVAGAQRLAVGAERQVMDDALVAVPGVHRLTRLGVADVQAVADRHQQPAAVREEHRLIRYLALPLPARKRDTLADLAELH